MEQSPADLPADSPACRDFLQSGKIQRSQGPVSKGLPIETQVRVGLEGILSFPLEVELP